MDPIVRRPLPLILTALLILTLFGACTKPADRMAEVKKRKELRVALEPGFLPFGMKKANGEWAGFDIDMMTAFAQYLGVKPVFMDVKWDGAIPALMTKKFELIVNAVTITEERAKTVAFTDPYYRAGLTVLLAKKHIGAIKKVEELNAPQFTVAVQLGTTGDIYAAKQFTKAKIIQMDSGHDASNAVLLGKIDAFINDKPFVTLFAKKHSGRVGILEDPFTEEYFGVVGRKQDKELIQEFNRFLGQWKSSGGYALAVKRNFEDMVWAKDFPELR